jgi:hypothetical protein
MLRNILASHEVPGRVVTLSKKMQKRVAFQKPYEVRYESKLPGRETLEIYEYASLLEATGMYGRYQDFINWTKGKEGYEDDGGPKK